MLINSGRSERASPAPAAGPPRPRTRPARPAPRRAQNRAPDRRAPRRSTAATASAHPDPAGPGNTGSGASARHHRVNTTRTASTRAAKRRNQPRTVSGGRPSSAAIRRCPTPAAFAASAAPITAAVSARRSQQQHRQQHMRRPQPVHRDRRGTTRHRAVRAADRPSPSPAPPGQHTRASRTRQPARSQPFLDPDRVGLYREHRASERNHTALPQLRPRTTAGGPWPTPTRRSSRWRRRRTRSTRLARQHADPHAQRRRPGPTSSS